ncbi:serine/threonine-protein kinase [Streptomyces sp. NPDC004111]|uniref:serine/threonine-protein kinase n=1 Tax=Streptomyces sp. NPDC004111 TaxID=3364690 RepID=UPI003680C038
MDRLGDGDPRTIGGYRLLGRLGEGGMGRVYLARSATGRTVAVKLIRAELAAQGAFRERFRQEVDAARRVGGDWTAPVLDADCDTEVPWVATGYIAGPSLADVITGHGPLPEHSVRTLARGLGHALSDIHAAGLIHRDLKPANVLVTIEGPRVIDFGIAKGLAGATLAATGLTSTGVVVGSPGCMSPEQIRDEALTPASDVFALGTVLSYAATGRLPFGDGGGSGGIHAVLFRITAHEPDLSDAPKALHPLIMACCAKDPRERPTPRELAEAAAGAADGAAVSPWLPSGLIAELGQRAVRLLDVDPEPEPGPEHRPPAGPPAPPVPDGHTGAPGTMRLGAGGPHPGAPPGGQVAAPLGEFGAVRAGPAPAGTPYGGPPAAGGAAPGGFHGGTPAEGVRSGPGGATASGPRTGARTRRGALVAAAAVAGVLAVGVAVAVPLLKGDQDDRGAARPGAQRPAGSPGASAPGGGAVPLPEGTPGTGGRGKPSATTGPESARPGAHPTKGGDGNGKAGGTAAATVPQGYVGTWIGSTLRNGRPIGQQRRFTVTAGSVGQSVMRSTSLDSGYECTTSGRLTSVEDGALNLLGSFASGASGSRCSIIKGQTLTLAPDGTLHWKGIDRTAVLRRVAAGSERIPAALIGRWERKLGSGGTQKVTVDRAAPGGRAVTLVAESPGKRCVSHANLFTASGGSAEIGPAVVDGAASSGECDTGSASTLRVSGSTLVRSYADGGSARTYTRS